MVSKYDTNQNPSLRLHKTSTILLEQIRTLDKSRLGGYIGSVDGEKMREVDAALEISVGAWIGMTKTKET